MFKLKKYPSAIYTKWYRTFFIVVW